MTHLALISLLFFVSGLSGLIYQVVWVREFGNVFGNTVYSASLVVAVLMLGLGVGSDLVGRWADRRYLARRRSGEPEHVSEPPRGDRREKHGRGEAEGAPDSLLRSYAVF